MNRYLIKYLAIAFALWYIILDHHFARIVNYKTLLYLILAHYSYLFNIQCLTVLYETKAMFNN